MKTKISDDQINYQDLNQKVMNQIQFKIIELDHNITTNYPKLPKIGETHQSKVYRNLISDIQVRLAEISAMIRNTDFSSYPDSYENCKDQQKTELNKLFNATKLLSLAIIHKLNANKFENAIPNENALILKKLSHQCYFLEENIKEQEIIDAKVDELNKGLCESKSYECKIGFQITISPGISYGQVFKKQKGTIEQLSAQLRLINERRKQLDYSYVPKSDQIEFLGEINSNVSQMFKGIFSSEPSSDLNKFINDVSIYIKSHPTKKAFLESIKNKDYEQALRRCCTVGDIYLMDLLIDYVVKNEIKLNLSRASSDGRTAHHFAAIFANKTGDLTCLIKLFDYSFEQSVSYNFCQDLKQKTYEDYLNEDNKYIFIDYQLSKLSSLKVNTHL